MTETSVPGPRGRRMVGIRSSGSRGSSGISGTPFLPVLLCLALFVPIPSRAQDRERPVLEVAKGSVARSQVVALDRDLRIDGEVRSDVAVVQGSVTVTGDVTGDVIVLGGDIRIGATGRVGGDLFALGGEVEMASGALVTGRTVSYPTLSAAWITLLEGPSLGASPTSPLVVGAKLALLFAWLLLALGLLATLDREILATSRGVRFRPFRSFAVGLTAVLSLVLSALFISSFAASLLGLPILFLIAFVAVALKLWGMVAVFHALGEWIGQKVRRNLLPVTAATLGLLTLGLLKLLPWIGIWTWTIATLIGVGAALITRMGRDRVAV
ncbi:MAG: hypothetical protein R3234_13550 [Thermoanaerobaculia bacterium]|nr:hypothetical protein [Thermoanaerobaculia bacterium]